MPVPVRVFQSTWVLVSESSDILTVILEAPGAVRRGEPVPMALIIANRADRTVTLYLRGREITFDVAVRRSSGQPVWRRLEDTGVLAILQVGEMKPGETITLRYVWDQRDRAGKLVAPGEYIVSAEVLTDGEPLRAGPVSLQIRRREKGRGKREKGRERDEGKGGPA